MAKVQRTERLVSNKGYWEYAQFSMDSGRKLKVLFKLNQKTHSLHDAKMQVKGYRSC